MLNIYIVKDTSNRQNQTLLNIYIVKDTSNRQNQTLNPHLSDV